MSTYTFPRKEVVARQDYDDYCRHHLEFGMIEKVDGKYIIDLDEAKRFNVSDEDIAILQEACNGDWKIKKGEKHVYSTGTCDGEFYAIRFSIIVATILTKYDLWYEE